MSSVLEVPAQLALAILLATGPAPAEPILPIDIEPRIAVPRTELGAEIAIEPEDLDASASTPKAEFGYSDELWLRLVQAHGETAGLGPLARRIFRTSSGRIYAPVPEDRKAVLALKLNPVAAASITTTVARANAQRLSRIVDRPVTSGDLYMAHKLGLDEAMRLLTAAEREPRRSAAEMMPAAALSNPAAFFYGIRPRTAEAVVQHYTAIFEVSVRGHLRASAEASAAQPQVTRAAPQQPTARAHLLQSAVAGWRTAITASSERNPAVTAVHAFPDRTATAN